MNNKLNPTERAHLARVKACSISGCARPINSFGYCHTHYMRMYRAGTIDRKRYDRGIDYIVKRVKIDEAGCWIWQLMTYNGYGKAGYEGHNRHAHVLAWEFANSQSVPNGLQINHRCHVRLCCNPHHLYAGTQAQNVADMYSAGRQRILRGEESGSSKITAADVTAIRSSDELARIIKNRFGISESLVRAIRKRQVWRHVP